MHSDTADLWQWLDSMNSIVRFSAIWATGFMEFLAADDIPKMQFLALSCLRCSRR